MPLVSRASARSSSLRRATSPATRASPAGRSTASTPQQHPDEFVERLLDWSRGRPEKPVLYYNGDWDLLAVSRFREQLSAGFRFVVPDETLVEDLVDKTRFQRLAEEHDLPVPRSVTLGARIGL